MRVAFVVMGAVLLLSCGPAVRHAGVVQQAVPVAIKAPGASDSSIDQREDDYREAAAFYLLKRSPDGTDLPMERYLQAKRHADRMPSISLAAGRNHGKAGARDIALGSWQQLGPGNVGGRTRSIVINPVDPNIMYAGSVGGGVWKTTDGGNSWFPLTDLLPSIGIGTLAMDPKNPDILYAGTGEWYTNSARGDSIRGLGIFKTTDGGATWAQLPDTATSSFWYVNKIVVSPVDSQHIYAATYGGVWASLDGGASWSRTLNRTSPNTGCQDLVIRSDQSTDYLFAACGTTAVSPSAIFRNVDAGGSGAWENVFTKANMARTSLALAPSNQSTVYAISANLQTGDYLRGLLGVYRSTSNGDPDSWETRVTNEDANRLNTLLLTNPREAMTDVCGTTKATYSNQGDYDNVIAVDPLNPDVVWVGGIDVFRSDDAGANWGIAGFWQASAPQLVHADVHALVFHPGYNGNNNQVLITGTDGGIYRTDKALAQTATGDRAACSPYPTQIPWTSLNNTYSVTQFYHGSVYPGGGSYWGGTQDNGTQRGTDGSGPNAWRRVISGDGGFTAIDPNDPNLLYGESQNFSFVRSTNGGSAFSSATRGITEATANFLFITPFQMDPSESKRLYIGGKTLWRTTDGAQNWTEASAPITNGSISAIAIAPSDPNRMVFGTSTGYIYRHDSALSTDKGSEWSSIQPRSGYLSRLTFDPSNPDVVYATYSQFKTATSQSHVYRSTDGGASWTGIDGSGDTGLPDIPVFSVIVDPLNTQNLYLGTDIGVFASTDGGNSWSRDDNPFANAVTETLTLDRSAGQSVLYAFTHGRGVWKAALPGSGDPCKYSVSADTLAVTAFGGPASVSVKTGDNCSWSAINAGGAATIASPAGGKGAGAITVNNTMNTSRSTRSTTITVQDKTVTVKQDSALSASGNDDRNTPFDLGSAPAVAVQDTRSATESDNDPVHSCTGAKDAKTVWFKFTPPADGTAQFAFYVSRADTGNNSGAVMSGYNAAGSQIFCSVQPQDTGLTQRTVSVPVNKGVPVLVEVSALASAAQVMGGNLVLTAQMR